MSKLLTVLSIAVVIFFMALAIFNLKEHQDTIELKSQEIKTLQTSIEKERQTAQERVQELEKAKRDKDATLKEKQRIEREKQSEIERLERELQAKLERKESERLANVQPQVAAATSPAPSGGNVEKVIQEAAAKYGVDASFMMRIANCESSFNHLARNPQPVIVNGVNYGHAEGLFQFIPGTWDRMSSQAGFGGYPVTDMYANANTAAWAFSTGHRAEWEC